MTTAVKQKDMFDMPIFKEMFDKVVAPEGQEIDLNRLTLLIYKVMAIEKLKTIDQVLKKYDSNKTKEVEQVKETKLPAYLEYENQFRKVIKMDLLKTFYRNMVMYHNNEAMKLRSVFNTLEQCCSQYWKNGDDVFEPNRLFYCECGHCIRQDNTEYTIDEYIDCMMEHAKQHIEDEHISFIIT